MPCYILILSILSMECVHTGEVIRFPALIKMLESWVCCWYTLLNKEDGGAAHGWSKNENKLDAGITAPGSFFFFFLNQDGMTLIGLPWYSYLNQSQSCLNQTNPTTEGNEHQIFGCECWVKFHLPPLVVEISVYICICNLGELTLFKINVSNHTQGSSKKKMFLQMSCSF